MGRRKVAVFVAVLAVAALLAIVLQAPVHALLAEPLAQLWLLVDAIPQRLIWIVVAVLGFVIAFSFSRGPGKEGSEPAQLRPPTQTQIERLSELVELAETSNWARDVLGRRLCHTAAGLRALQEGIRQDEARDEIRSGRWPLNPSLVRVFHPQETGRRRDYAREMACALDALEGYAQEGDL